MPVEVSKHTPLTPDLFVLRRVVFCLLCPLVACGLLSLSKGGSVGLAFAGIDAFRFYDARRVQRACALRAAQSGSDGVARGDGYPRGKVVFHAAS
jgi:hypothetical protein